MRYISAIVLVLVLSATACFAREVKLLDPPVLYQISNHPKSGFFTKVHGVAIDEDGHAVYVLHDTPAALSSFYLEDGNPMEQISLQQRVEEPADLAFCFGEPVIISERQMWRADREGRMELFFEGTRAATQTVDIAACFFSDLLVAVDREKRQMKTITKSGEVSIIACGGKCAESPKANKIIAGVHDLAVSDMGGIYILDASMNKVTGLDNIGSVFETISLSDPFDSYVPLDVTAITIDHHNNLWVADYAERYIDVYDSFGDLRARIEDVDSTGFRFTDPAALDSDSQGRLFVTDAGPPEIIVYDIKYIVDLY